MAMEKYIEFGDFLNKFYDCDLSNGKYIKHADGSHNLRKLWLDNLLELYQSFQDRAIFNCKFIISFIGEGQDRARFLGIYDVKSCVRIEDCGHNEEKIRTVYAENAKFFYVLEKRSGFEDIENRVIIKWGGSQLWHHKTEKTKKEIWQILPKGYYYDFPGIENLTITFKELSWIINNKDANVEWLYGLSSVKGVYMILDKKEGRQYIGSAIGNNGIWQRWSEYVQSGGHGNNEKLLEIIKNDPRRVDEFNFSILKFFPKEIDNQKVLKTESFLKKALGTRVVGLNAN